VQVGVVITDSRDAGQVARGGRVVVTAIRIHHWAGSPPKLESEMTMAVTDVSRFERFFRRVAGLDVDKSDLRRHDAFVDEKLYDLLLRAEANAKANGRDIVEYWDLPITKGLQECIDQFEQLDDELRLSPALERITAYPVSALACSDDARARLPGISGGMSVALARTMTILDPAVKNPSSEHWERAMQIFAVLQ
jgi:hypothetical protein